MTATELRSAWSRSTGMTRILIASGVPFTVTQKTSAPSSEERIGLRSSDLRDKIYL